jgi:hypothetical protein
MKTYVLLKNGEIWVVWSDNTEEETYTCFPLQDLKDYDPEWQSYTTFPYTDIETSDTNLSLLQSLEQKDMSKQSITMKNELEILQ